MGAANEMPNPSLKWQDLAIQKLNCHRNSIFGETKKKIGISTQEPGRIASFPNTLIECSGIWQLLECPGMSDYRPARETLEFPIFFIVSPRNEFPGEFDARTPKSSLSKGGFGNLSILPTSCSFMKVSLYTHPSSSHLGIFLSYFLSPGCNRKKSSIP